MMDAVQGFRDSLMDSARFKENAEMTAEERQGGENQLCTSR